MTHFIQFEAFFVAIESNAHHRYANQPEPAQLSSVLCSRRYQTISIIVAHTNTPDRSIHTYKSNHRQPEHLHWVGDTGCHDFPLGTQQAGKAVTSSSSTSSSPLCPLFPFYTHFLVPGFPSQLSRASLYLAVAH